MSLEELPRMQFHVFCPWVVDTKICASCGQLPQAHPATQEIGDEARRAETAQQQQREDVGQ